MTLLMKEMRWEPGGEESAESERVLLEAGILGVQFEAFRYTCTKCSKRHALIRISCSPSQRAGCATYLFGLVTFEEIYTDISSIDDVKRLAAQVIMQYTGIDISQTEYDDENFGNMVPPKEELH